MTFLNPRLSLIACLCALWLSVAANAQTTPTTQTSQAPEMHAVQVMPDVYYVKGQSALGSAANQNFISNAGFVVTAEGVVVVDALGSPALAQRLVAEIAKVTEKPIKVVVLTHYHADHIYGLQVFKKLGAHVMAHEAGREYLNSETARLRLEASRHDLAPWVNADTRLVFADQWISGPTEFKLGGLTFQVQPVGPSHTAEDVVVFVPEKKVLFAGDLVFRNRIPFVGQADSRHWIEAMESLLKFDAQVVVPGHGELSREPKADMTLTRDYLVYLRDSMGRAAADMLAFEEAYKATDWSRFQTMPLFRAANRMNAYNTYLLMEREAK